MFFYAETHQRWSLWTGLRHTGDLASLGWGQRSACLAFPYAVFVLFESLSPETQPQPLLESTSAARFNHFLWLHPSVVPLESQLYIMQAAAVCLPFLWKSHLPPSSSSSPISLSLPQAAQHPLLLSWEGRRKAVGSKPGKSPCWQLSQMEACCSPLSRAAVTGGGPRSAKCLMGLLWGLAKKGRQGEEEGRQHMLLPGPRELCLGGGEASSSCSGNFLSHKWPSSPVTASPTPSPRTWCRHGFENPLGSFSRWVFYLRKGVTMSRY